MAKYLNATGRHIVYSCEWPMYKKAQGGTVSLPDLSVVPASSEKKKEQKYFQAILVVHYEKF